MVVLTTMKVSSDRIFRVRSKQPNEESKTKLSEVTNTCSKDQKIPVINNYIMVGEYYVSFNNLHQSLDLAEYCNSVCMRVERSLISKAIIPQLTIK